MVRQRVEDLGKLAVMLQNLLDSADLEEIYGVRNKDFSRWFYEQTEDKRYELLNGFVYGRENIKDALYKMIEIADGMDPLNEPPEL